jgi:hypothetical protein
MGTAYATLLVGLSSFVVWFAAKKVFDVQIVKTIIKPAIATILILLFGFAFQSLNLISIYNIIGKIIISVFIYGIFHFIFSKKEIEWFWEQLKLIKK